PNYDRALYNMANTLREQGRAISAVAAYKAALAVRPHWRDAHLNLANAYYDLKDFDNAAAEYQKAKDLSPNDAELDESLGNVLLAQGRIEEARAAYRRALGIKPGRWPRELRVAAMTPPVVPDAPFIDEYRSKLSETVDRFRAANLK